MYGRIAQWIEEHEAIVGEPRGGRISSFPGNFLRVAIHSARLFHLPFRSSFTRVARRRRT